MKVNTQLSDHICYPCFECGNIHSFWIQSIKIENMIDGWDKCYDFFIKELLIVLPIMSGNDEL